MLIYKNMIECLKVRGAFSQLLERSNLEKHFHDALWSIFVMVVRYGDADSFIAR